MFTVQLAQAPDIVTLERARVRDILKVRSAPRSSCRSRSGNDELMIKPRHEERRLPIVGPRA